MIICPTKVPHQQTFVWSAVQVSLVGDQYHVKSTRDLQVGAHIPIVGLDLQPTRLRSAYSYEVDTDGTVLEGAPHIETYQNIGFRGLSLAMCIGERSEKDPFPPNCIQNGRWIIVIRHIPVGQELCLYRGTRHVREMLEVTETGCLQMVPYRLGPRAHNTRDIPWDVIEKVRAQYAEVMSTVLRSFSVDWKLPLETYYVAGRALALATTLTCSTQPTRGW